MTSILLIGNQGQLGWELERSLLPLGPLTAVDYPDIDLTDQSSLNGWVRKIQPDVIINAAAYTDVDGAENDLDLAYQVNAEAPGYLARLARDHEAVLVHYSTDYVFDGRKGAPYQESDPVKPINAYGKSKLEGELMVQDSGACFFIFRTSWLYSLRKSSFVTKVLNWARTKEDLRIVTDQTSSPTWSRTLAESTTLWLVKYLSSAILQERFPRGVYHLAGSGAVSRFEWAQQILSLDPHPEDHSIGELKTAVSSDFPTPAQRPAYSALDCSRFQQDFDLSNPYWLTCLQQAMAG